MRNKPALGMDVFFIWKIANSGYQWCDIPERGRLLCAVDAFCPDWNGIFDRYQRSYWPFQEVTGLFLELAELPPTEPAVLEFANRYGMLKLEDPLTVATDFGPVVLHGESLEWWRGEIETLKNAVDLWHAMLKGKDELVSLINKHVGDPDQLPLKLSHLLHLDHQDLAMAALGAVQRSTSFALRREVDVDFLFSGKEPRLHLSLKPL